MIGNSAFLLQACVQEQFAVTCQRLGSELGADGLILEVSGPWPAYHFCPTLDP